MTREETKLHANNLKSYVIYIITRKGPEIIEKLGPKRYSEMINHISRKAWPLLKDMIKKDNEYEERWLTIKNFALKEFEKYEY